MTSNRKPAKRRASARRSPDQPGRGQTIMLIEDEPLLISLYVSVLEKMTEAEILTASEEQEALRMILERRPRIVLLDLMIPTRASSAPGDFHEPVGFDLLRRIKNNPKTKPVHVIILSNLDADEHREQATKLGAEDYIVKAMLNPRELADRLSVYLTVGRSSPR